MFLAKLGIEVAAVYVPDPSPVVEKHRNDARKALGVTGIPVDRSPFGFLPVLRALERNAFVAIQGDRDVSGTGPLDAVLRQDRVVPDRPVPHRAGLRRAHLPGLRPAGRGRPVQDRGRGADPRAAGARRAGACRRPREGLATFVGRMEATIRAYPTQWYRFARFWESEE